MTDREKLIEAMARAMCREGGFDPDEIMPNDGPRWRYYVPGATAALAAIEAEGAVIVPVSVTVGMFAALTRNLITAETRGRGITPEFFGAWGIGSFNEDYAAMLAASPYAKDKTDEA